MDWLSLDTDIFQDGEITELLRKHRGDGFTIYIYILTNVANNIDLENSKNGYFDSGGDPVGQIAWEFHTEQEYVEEILQTLDDLDLIEYEDNEIFVEKILRRKHTETYLNQQKAGIKGAKARWGNANNGDVVTENGDTKANGGANGSPNNDPKDGGNGGPDANKIRLDKDNNKQDVSADAGNDYSRKGTIEKYGEPAVKATEYLIDKIKGYNEKTPVAKAGSKKWDRWVKAMDRLNRLGPSGGDDGYSWQEIRDIIDWTFQDDFWQKQIQSATGLREKIIKLDNASNNQKGADNNGGAIQSKSGGKRGPAANRKRLEEKSSSKKEAKGESGAGSAGSSVPF